MLGITGDQVPIAMTDPNRGDFDQDLAIARLRQIDLFDSKGLTGSVEDSGANLHVRNLPLHEG